MIRECLDNIEHSALMHENLSVIFPAYDDGNVWVILNRLNTEKLCQMCVNVIGVSLDCMKISHKSNGLSGLDPGDMKSSIYV